VANGSPTQTLRRCRSQFCKPARFPPSLAVQAAAAPPQQAQRRRFTAHGSVSLRRCPCFPATRRRPQSDCHAPVCPTRKFADAPAKPAPQPFWGNLADHCSRQRCRPRSSSSVTFVPPATLPLLFDNPPDPQEIPPSAAEWKTDAQQNPKRLSQPVLQACSCLSCLAAQAAAAAPQQAQRRRFTPSLFRFTLALPLLFCPAPANATVFHDLVIPPI
jgi:hypothetical protein